MELSDSEGETNSTDEGARADDGDDGDDGDDNDDYRVQEDSDGGSSENGLSAEEVSEEVSNDVVIAFSC